MVSLSLTLFCGTISSKSAVTALRFNASGSLLASGSQDTDLILWDVVSEAGLYRLRGHKDQVTDLVRIDIDLFR